MEFIELKATAHDVPSLRLYIDGTESGYRERVALAHAILFTDGQTPNKGDLYLLAKGAAESEPYGTNPYADAIKATYDPHLDTWAIKSVGIHHIKVWLEASESLEDIAVQGYKFFDIIIERVGK